MLTNQNYKVTRVFTWIKELKKKRANHHVSYSVGVMLNCLVVLSFFTIIASASNNAEGSSQTKNDESTVLVKSVSSPTTYTSSEKLLAKASNEKTPTNIANETLAEVAGTDTIEPVHTTQDVSIEVMVLDMAENEKEQNENAGRCEENNIALEAKETNLVEAGSPNDDSLLYRYAITDDEYQILLRIVEAEVTGESFTYNEVQVSEEELLRAKIRVAQVFLNRVEENKKFVEDKTLRDALLRKGASSTLLDGRYYEVTITDLTRKAVDLALLNETPDYTENALFFSSGTTHCKYGEYIFTDGVGHSFFK